MDSNFIRCPQCGTRNFAEDKFCGICKTDLTHLTQVNAKSDNKVPKEKGYILTIILVAAVGILYYSIFNERNSVQKSSYPPLENAKINSSSIASESKENNGTNLNESNSEEKSSYPSLENAKINPNLIASEPEENKGTDLSKNFSKKILRFKSTSYDKELYGQIIQTNTETTYHTFDFVNNTITMRAPFEGEWMTITYYFDGFYEERGLRGTNYVFQIHDLGVKEVWVNFDIPNLGYDYDDGSRIALYDLKVE